MAFVEHKMPINSDTGIEPILRALRGLHPKKEPILFDDQGRQIRYSEYPYIVKQQNRVRDQQRNNTGEDML